jgi:hypothetical protein
METIMRYKHNAEAGPDLLSLLIPFASFASFAVKDIL